MNDDLIGGTLIVCTVFIGGLAALTGAGTAYYSSAALGTHPDPTVVSLLAALCYAVGYAMAATFTGVLTSATRTVFVCFARNPEAGAVTHPDTLAALSKAWAGVMGSGWATCPFSSLVMLNQSVSIPVAIMMQQQQQQQQQQLAQSQPVPPPPPPPRGPHMVVVGGVLMTHGQAATQAYAQQQRQQTAAVADAATPAAVHPAWTHQQQQEEHAQLQDRGLDVSRAQSDEPTNEEDELQPLVQAQQQQQPPRPSAPPDHMGP